MKFKNNKIFEEKPLIRINENEYLKTEKIKLFKFTNEIIFLIANIIYFIINILFLYSSKNFKNFYNNLSNGKYKQFINNNIVFKNIDKYTFTLLHNSYENIGNYLNDKYNTFSNLNISSNKTEEKKIISICGVNLNSREEFQRTLLWYLKDRFIVQLIVLSLII